MPRARSPGALDPAVSAESENTESRRPILPSFAPCKKDGGMVHVYYFVDKERHICLFSGTSARARPGVSPLKDR